MQFKKGSSGNPGGRPTIPDELKQKLADLTPDAIKRLGELLNSKSERVSIRAAEVILDRAWGKPAQPLEHTGIESDRGLETEQAEKEFKSLTDKERDRVILAAFPEPGNNSKE